MIGLAVPAVALIGGLAVGTSPPSIPDAKAVEIIEDAEDAFIDAVTDRIGEPSLVACAIDEFEERDEFDGFPFQCYGLVFGDEIGDSTTLAMQTGWIDEMGEFFSVNEPHAMLLAEGDDQPDDSADEIRQAAEDYLVSFEFEDALTAAGRPGRIENPRCATPDSTEAGDTFECHFDRVTSDFTFLTRVDFAGG
jgi:hypothetical protein